MKLIGITGGIAMGKSTIMNFLDDLGIYAIDCDRLARQVYMTDEVQDYVLNYRDVHHSSEVPNIMATRRWMLAEPEFKKGLEDLMFPEIEKLMLEDEDAQVVEVPLLYEAGLEHHFKTVWAVICSPENQLARLTIRTQDEDLARKMIGIQMPATEKAAKADFVFNTDCDKEETYSQVIKALKAEGLI